VSFTEYLMQDRAFLEKRIKEQDEYLRNLDDRVIRREIDHDRYLDLFNSAFDQKLKFTDSLYLLEKRNRLYSERVVYMLHYINL